MITTVTQIKLSHTETGGKNVCFGEAGQEMETPILCFSGLRCPCGEILTHTHNVEVFDLTATQNSKHAASFPLTIQSEFGSRGCQDLSIIILNRLNFIRQNLKYLRCKRHQFTRKSNGVHKVRHVVPSGKHSNCHNFWVEN